MSETRLKRGRNEAESRMLLKQFMTFYFKADILWVKSGRGTQINKNLNHIQSTMVKVFSPGREEK